MQTLAWVMAALCVVGTVLNIGKNKWCFVAWGIANVGFIAINIVAGIWGQVALFTMQFAFSVYGYIKWASK